MVRDGETNGERKEATFAVSSLATGNEQIERAVTDWRMEHCCLECTPFLPPPAARGLTLMPHHPNPSPPAACTCAPHALVKLACLLVVTCIKAQGQVTLCTESSTACLHGAMWIRCAS